MTHVYSTLDLAWIGDNLHLGRGRRLLGIVPDVSYPEMWRVELPDGHLTDMVNRVRAKDAAMAHALRMLNPRPKKGH